MKRLRVAAVLLVCVLLCLGIAGCGKSQADLQNLRELSWDKSELTISLGTNKGTGCEWSTDIEDDSVIDYSINRVFHLSDDAVKGETYGILDAGFRGVGPGTTKIICTTPVGWDGTGEGYTYTVTVTVTEDGTIDSATGE